MLLIKDTFINKKRVSQKPQKHHSIKLFLLIKVITIWITVHSYIQNKMIELGRGSLIQLLRAPNLQLCLSFMCTTHHHIRCKAPLQVQYHHLHQQITINHSITLGVDMALIIRLTHFEHVHGMDLWVKALLTLLE